jgi:hypothetical protein
VVELLQHFDLFTEGGALALQAPHDVVIPLLSFTLQRGRIGLGILDYLDPTRARIGQDLVGFASPAVGLRLRLADDLLGRRACIGQGFTRVLARTVGMSLCFADDLLGGGPGIRPDAASLVLGTGDMIVSGPLGQNQHLKRLPLGVWIESAVHIV